VAKGAPQVILQMAINVGDVKTAAEKAILDFAGRGFRSLGVAKADEEVNGSLSAFCPCPTRHARMPKRPLQRRANGREDQDGDGRSDCHCRETSKELGLARISWTQRACETKKKESPEVVEQIEKADGFAQVFPSTSFILWTCCRTAATSSA